MAAGDSSSNPINTRSVKTDPAFSASAIITPAASATDIATLVGSATKKVYVQRVFISGTQTTGGQAIVQLVKRTVLDTAGTATQPTIARHSTAVAPVAVFNAYSANPSALGTGAVLRTQRVPVGATTVTTNNTICIDLTNSPVQLDGAAESLAVYLNAVTLTGGSLHVSIEWTEGE